nr:hypothetical protein [Tanacetum cinerariifolium]
MACKSLMLELGQSGMRPCHVKKAINAMKPPYVADVTSKQCSDILSKLRKQYKGKEFYGLINHFQDKTSVDMNQYFKIGLNSDGSPRNIFWADGRSHDAYIKFGHVVVFDVTYLTNKFKFSFAPFVGVNHHDMMPQICVRDSIVKIKTKGRPKIATRVKSPIELQGNKRRLVRIVMNWVTTSRGVQKKKLFPQAGALPNNQSSSNEMHPLAMYVPEPGRGSSVPIDLFTAFALTSQSSNGLEAKDLSGVVIHGGAWVVVGWLLGGDVVVKVASKDGSESHNRNLLAILTTGVVSCSTLSDQGYAEDFYDQ